MTDDKVPDPASPPAKKTRASCTLRQAQMETQKNGTVDCPGCPLRVSANGCHSCPRCTRVLHKFCGKPDPDAEEGYGQPVYCKTADCKTADTTEP